jgi:hypothetical protein
MFQGCGNFIFRFKSYFSAYTATWRERGDDSRLDSPGNAREFASLVGGCGKLNFLSVCRYTVAASYRTRCRSACFLCEPLWLPSRTAWQWRNTGKKFCGRNVPAGPMIHVFAWELEKSGCLLDESGKYPRQMPKATTADVYAKLELSPRKYLRRLSHESGFP